MKNGITVEENLVNLIAKIGEKITIGILKTIESQNSQNFTYQHSVIKDNVSKLGVIVSLETNQKNDKINVFGKNLYFNLNQSYDLNKNNNYTKQINQTTRFSDVAFEAKTKFDNLFFKIVFYSKL